MSRVRVVVVVVCVLVLCSSLAGSVMARGPFDAPPDPADPGLLPYRGDLSDAAGIPVPDGDYDLAFAIYDAPEDGLLLWTENQPGITVQDGALLTTLGRTQPITKEVRERKAVWLAVSVRGPGEQTFTPLSPRQMIETDVPADVNALTCPHSHFTDSWSGSSSTYGLYLSNASTGDGLRVYSKATNIDYGAIYARNISTTGGPGVVAKSEKGIGVRAWSGAGDAIDATTDAPLASAKSAVYAHATNGYGVWGISTNRAGVHGQSANAFGVEAVGAGDASSTDLKGDLFLGGQRGEIFGTGSIVGLYGNGWITFDLDNDNNGAHQLEVWSGSDQLVFRVDEAGNTTATGTKSAVVQTKSYGQRLLYAVESPEVWFEDIGSAKLANGVAKVPFEPIFQEAANLATPYHVFVTAVCEKPVVLTVSEKLPTGFTVKGVTLREEPSDCEFEYRVIANRPGYEGTRLAPDTVTPNSRQAEEQP